MLVLKFGGSSVGTERGLSNTLSLIESALKADPHTVIVVSAFHGVTDQLIGMAHSASRGEIDCEQQLQNLSRRHLDTLDALVGKGKAEGAVRAVERLLKDLGDVLHGVRLVKDLSPKILDLISSFGEQLSAVVITEIVRARVSKPSAIYVDASALVKTDSGFGNAKIRRDETYDAINKHLELHPLPWIVTGFIGTNSKGERTTLGRGGSDYTAAIFGAALKAGEVQIWTDVDGFMTADPRKVKKAISIEQLTYEEAMELSHFGAKVVFPPTLQPLFEQGIPVKILNTMRPEFKGSLISNSAAPSQRKITGISSISDIALVTLLGSGMVGVAGVASRLFGALSQQEISVILISQASSEHSICLAIQPTQVKAARRAVEEEFALEIQAGQIQPLEIELQQSIVAVVGANMKNTAGLAAQLFQAFGRNGINIKAIAQGSSELNISVVIARADETKAVRAIHDAFFLSDIKTLHLYLVGVGQVGRTLLKQIEEHRQILRQNHNLEIKVVGLADSKHYVIDPEGIEIAEWKTALSGAVQKMAIEDFVTALRHANLPSSIFVDCTSSADVAAFYGPLLKSNISVITPNKKANSAELSKYDNLHQAARSSTVRFYYETNVGAGLPVISTLRDLLVSGDEVLRIEAVLSGTLSYIFNSFSGERKFSDIVAEAKARGYTEPDPRDDLSGTDVARKLLILSREIGLKLEQSQIEVQNLVPVSCAAAPTPEAFLNQLKQNDSEFEQLKHDAEKSGKRLRYIGVIEGGKASVQLSAVDQAHPFYDLSGSDNVISFITKRYCDRPLVVKGPGAGTEVTAAGVFADIVRASTYLM